MHIVTLESPVKDARWDLQPRAYVCEDLSAWELAIAAKRGTATVRPLVYPSRLRVERLLLISNGGFGDMLLLVPALRAMHSKRPEIRLTLSCRNRVHCVFENLPYAPSLVDYPISVEDAAHFDQIITTEHLQEDSDEGRSVAAVDIKARILGVGPLVGEERRAEYVATAAETTVAEFKCPRLAGRPRIGIQLQASSPTRTYHPQRAGDVMQRLYALGYELYIFGSPGSLPQEKVPERIRDRVRNLTAENLSFRESVAVMGTCDVLFCPDSSMVHVAGALGIPCVAVFGSTHWKLRTADYPSVFVLQGNGGCKISPCWHHPKGATIWPEEGPCATAGHCPVINNIPPERIVAEIQKKLAAARPA